MLLEALNPSYRPPEHPTLAAARSPVATPTPADPKLLQTFHIPCGVNQSVPLGAGLDRVLKPLLAKFRESLSLKPWHAVCMQSMHITQAFLEALAGPKEASPRAAGIAESENLRTDSDSGDNNRELTCGNAKKTTEVVRIILVS